MSFVRRRTEIAIDVVRIVSVRNRNESLSVLCPCASAFPCSFFFQSFSKKSFCLLPLGQATIADQFAAELSLEIV